MKTMILEQFNQTRDELHRQINELTKGYLALSPFQPGDKVLVTYTRMGEEKKEALVIKHVVPGGRYSAADYEYGFARIKKDGEPSLNHVYIPSDRIIEKFESHDAEAKTND